MRPTVGDVTFERSVNSSTRKTTSARDVPTPIHFGDPNRATAPSAKDDAHVQTTSTTSNVKAQYQQKMLLPTVFATRILLCPPDPLINAANFSGNVVASDSKSGSKQ